MFPVFCFSEIGIDFLKITLKENMIPENLFACSSDKKGNKETMRNLCSKNNIKYIEIKKESDPFIYVKEKLSIKENNLKIMLLWCPHILKKNLLQNITNIVNIHPSYLSNSFN